MLTYFLQYFVAVCWSCYVTSFDIYRSNTSEIQLCRFKHHNTNRTMAHFCFFFFVNKSVLVVVVMLYQLFKDECATHDIHPKALFGNLLYVIKWKQFNRSQCLSLTFCWLCLWWPTPMATPWVPRRVHARTWSQDILYRHKKRLRHTP